MELVFPYAALWIMSKLLSISLAADALGVKGGNMHSVEEFAWLKDLKRCAKQAIVIALEIN